MCKLCFRADVPLTLSVKRYLLVFIFIIFIYVYVYIL